jgi:carbamoyl-phosphate synthase large subunit
MQNILILSAGRRVSLTEAFLKEASAYDCGIRVYAADANPDLSAACKITESFKLPKVSSSLYIEVLRKNIKEKNITVVIPTIDTELIALSQIRDEMENQGVFLLTPPADFVKICRNKRLTHEFFKKHGIEVANEMSRSSLMFPLFAKPIDGSSSNHLYFAAGITDLPPAVLNDERFMLLEYLNPADYSEYTIDMYYNRMGNICSIVPRLRIETRSGEVSKGVTKRTGIIDYLKTRFNKMEGFRGCITMQFFVHKKSGNIKGIEINPRFGGGYPLSYFAGANFPKWIIEEYIFNKNVDWSDHWTENLLMLRYDKEILINDFNGI